MLNIDEWRFVGLYRSNISIHTNNRMGSFFRYSNIFKSNGSEFGFLTYFYVELIHMSQNTPVSSRTNWAMTNRMTLRKCRNK